MYFVSSFFCSYLHIGIQICTVLCGLFGFIIIVVYTVKVDGKQFGKYFNKRIFFIYERNKRGCSSCTPLSGVGQ